MKKPKTEYVDFKKTVWERIILPTDEEKKKEAIDAIIGGLVTTGDELVDHYDCDTLYTAMPDTEEYLAPLDNDGYATIEIMGVNGDVFWSNSELKS